MVHEIVRPFVASPVFEEEPEAADPVPEPPVVPETVVLPELEDPLADVAAWPATVIVPEDVEVVGAVVVVGAGVVVGAAVVVGAGVGAV